MKIPTCSSCSCQHNTFIFIHAFSILTGRLKYLTLTEANRVWMPDLFFSNEKEGHFHNIIMPNVYIRIFPYGSVLYSIRISLTLACPMNLKLYPLDRQTCSLRMASCKCCMVVKAAFLSLLWRFLIATRLLSFILRLDGWTTADLVFLWKEGDPVQVVKNLHLPRFTLEKFLTDYCNSKTNTGECWACVEPERWRSCRGCCFSAPPTQHKEGLTLWVYSSLTTRELEIIKMFLKE